MIKSFFASSVDPTQVSLTLSSAFKVLGYVATAYCMAKGFDPLQATNGVTQLRDLSLQLVPAGFAVFHIVEMMWGIARKFTLVPPVQA